jgi:hypothetical protein
MSYDPAPPPGLHHRLQLKKEIEIPARQIGPCIIKIIVRIVIRRIHWTGTVNRRLIPGRVRRIFRLIRLRRRKVPVTGSQRRSNQHQLYRLGLFHIDRV